MKKLNNISLHEKVAILKGIIHNLKDLKNNVIGSTPPDYEMNFGPTSYFINAKFTGNNDEFIAFNDDWCSIFVIQQHPFAEPWLEAINQMERLFENMIFETDLKLGKLDNSITLLTSIEDADNQTRAFIIHFRVQMGDIPAEYISNTFKVIKQQKYIEECDKNSYHEYRRIIRDEVTSERIVACCNTIVSLRDVNDAIKAQAKSFLPR